MTTLVFEGKPEVDSVDGDAGLILTVMGDTGPSGDGLYVQIHSYNEQEFDHPRLDPFKGKRVRVTVEVLEDQE